MELRADVAFTRPSLSEIKTKKSELIKHKRISFVLFSECSCELDFKIQYLKNYLL